MFSTTQSTNLLSLKANQVDLISGFTHLISTTSTINNNFNNYNTITQSTNLLNFKANQVDLISGFTHLNNEITGLSTSLNNVFNNTSSKLSIS